MKNLVSVLFATFLCVTVSAQLKFADPRDGNVYGTIKVNGITWMSENLRYTGTEGVHYFDNDKNNLPIYGALYEWKAAVNACPAGWRLPSGSEYRSLMNHFESNSWEKGPSDAFRIQLGGFQDLEGVFSEVDESGYYWTSTEYDQDNAEYFSYLIIHDKRVIDISRKEDITDIRGSEKTNRYSVRCVKD